MQVTFEIPFSCDDNIRPHLEKVFSGEYDLRVALPAGARIIDLGANCGAFSVWATHRWPGCSVFAYEPHPETFKILRKNIEPHPNIKAHNFGVGTPGLRVLHNGPNNSGEASFHIAENNAYPTGQHLEVLPPSALPEADVIKLDIEGCEMEVLGPLIEAGRKFDLILLEFHNEALRRAVDSLLANYTLVGSEIQSILGRGIAKYMHNDLHRTIYEGAFR